MVSGNTVYYLKFADDEAIYTAVVTKSDLLPFAKAGQTVELVLKGNVIEKIEFK